MKTLLLIVTLLSCNATVYTQTFFKTPFAHTYSIVAVDSATGEIGAAVQSHWFSVGSIVIWAEAGVGAVATQSLVNASYGPRGLALLKQGISPEEVVRLLTGSDPASAIRQLGVIDAGGNSAAFTGSGCIPEAGHLTGDFYAVQANLMLRQSVWPAMEKAFLHTEAPLAERLIAALEAAQAEGGDIRGKQSAALLVVRGEATGNIWEDRLIDLRVEDHPEPVQEIKRLLRVYRAYDHMNAGDLALETNDIDRAVHEYSAAESMFPQNHEMKFWHAVTLASNGRVDDALPLFKAVFAADPNWKILVPRLVPIKFLIVPDADLKRILDQ